MECENRIVFEPFCLDLAAGCLWRGSDTVKLRPKAFAVLSYLVSRSGHLVSKRELLEAVWGDTFVCEGVLKVCIRQLRATLGDDPNAPKFIETAHRRGYRFVGHIAKNETAKNTPAKDEPANDDPMHAPATENARPIAARPAPPVRKFSSARVVGRDEALTRMHTWLEKMQGGERQIVFVTGEAGIGKTALADVFAGSLGPDDGIAVARGQCLEQYGTSEAYMPVLEAIGRLCRQHSQVIDVLRAHAPMWLLQMPSVVSASDRERLRGELLGATRERMLREMSEALEVLTAELPLVLIFEDLHWSDYSTLDLISYLARQRHSARLMLIGTYRTAELIVSGHPLKAVKQELLAKQQCEELPLEYLNDKEVAEYLNARFSLNRFPPSLAGLIHERTEGNPLFMVNAIDYLVADGLIAERPEGWELVVEIEKVDVGVPDSIRHMIEKQLEHLNPEQQETLEAASVAGAQFSSLAVAAGLREGRLTVEARCDELARNHQFLRECGIRELPNGEAVSRYGFIHTLYQNALYERLSSSRRMQLHRRIGEQGVALFGERAREIAAELAMHLERGGNYKHAVKYLQHAAENEVLRFAYQEAAALAKRGLELLSKLPDDRDRARQELALQLTLGVPLMATQGYAAPDVGAAYRRARELCQQLGETTEVSKVLWGLRAIYTVRGELGTALEMAEEFLQLSERPPHTGLAMRGHLAMEVTFLHLGQFEPAMRHFEKASFLFHQKRQLDDSFHYAQSPGVAMFGFAAWSLWFLGQPDSALKRIRDALSHARERSDPHGLAPAFFYAAMLHQFRREHQLAQEYAEAAIDVSAEHGLVLYQARATIARGWAVTNGKPALEGTEQMRQGLAAHRASGTQALVPHFMALLADAFGRSGQVEEALRLSEEALSIADHNGERYYQAELYRIKGELLFLQATGRGLSRAAAAGDSGIDIEPREVAHAEDCFRRSIELARQQKANSWELRAMMSLAHLLEGLGRKREAIDGLTKIRNAFTEGSDTVDLREAGALLESLS